MAQHNPGLKTPMPVSKGFKYGSAGARDGNTVTKKETGGDLRARKSKNNGKL
ncbi:MAG: hypothetical protein M0R06_22485 [Sphaerochaeta sp.]|jgi:hypothetical protein|nr:hypothetical protein [Sphaerochaeta sp.]